MREAHRLEAEARRRTAAANQTQYVQSSPTHSAPTQRSDGTKRRKTLPAPDIMPSEKRHDDIHARATATPIDPFANPVFIDDTPVVTTKPGGGRKRRKTIPAALDITLYEKRHDAIHRQVNSDLSTNPMFGIATPLTPVKPADGKKRRKTNTPPSVTLSEKGYDASQGTVTTAPIDLFADPMVVDDTPLAPDEAR